MPDSYETKDGSAIRAAKVIDDGVLLDTEDGIIFAEWESKIVGGMCSVELTDIAELNSVEPNVWVALKRG